MDTTFAPTTMPSEAPLWKRWLAAEVLAVITAVALVTAFVAQSAASSPDLEAANPGLSAQQIVTRGEVADRYQTAGAGLSAEQIVIRGEVADRYDAQADAGLSAEQIVIRAEVADRYAK